jgi:hypothetical protein
MDTPGVLFLRTADIGRSAGGRRPARQPEGGTVAGTGDTALTQELGTGVL